MFRTPRPPRWRGLIVPAAVSLAVVAVAALPSVVSPSIEPSLSDTTAFVQEGTRVAVPGRIVPLDVGGFRYGEGVGDLYNRSPVPESTSDLGLAGTTVIRTDGSTVRVTEISGHAPSDDLKVVAVASDDAFESFALRSDGSIHARACCNTKVLRAADGLTYTAVAKVDDHVLALRSDGRLAGMTWEGSPAPIGCESDWAPPAGLSYTAVSGARGKWIALRSDGRAVACGYADTDPTASDIIEPAAGEKFDGVSAGVDFAYLSESGERIVPVGALATPPPAVPDGRALTGISAGGVSSLAILDNGTLLTWGREIYVPRLPDGARYLTAWLGPDGTGHAIVSSDLTETRLTADVPARVEFADFSRNSEPTFAVSGSVSAPGYTPSGQVCGDYIRDSSAGEACTEVRPDGTFTLDVPFEPSLLPVAGQRTMTITFAADTGYRRATLRSDFLITPPEDPTISVSGPTRWAVDQPAILEVEVRTAAGIPAEGEVLVHLGEYDYSGTYVTRWLRDGRAQVLMPEAPVGTHDVDVTYEAAVGPSPSEAWSTTVTIEEAS